MSVIAQHCFGFSQQSHDTVTGVSQLSKGGLYTQVGIPCYRLVAVSKAVIPSVLSRNMLGNTFSTNRMFRLTRHALVFRVSVWMLKPLSMRVVPEPGPRLVDVLQDS